MDLGEPGADTVPSRLRLHLPSEKTKKNKTPIVFPKNLIEKPGDFAHIRAFRACSVGQNLLANTPSNFSLD